VSTGSRRSGPLERLEHLVEWPLAVRSGWVRGGCAPPGVRCTRRARPATRGVARRRSGTDHPPCTVSKQLAAAHPEQIHHRHRESNTTGSLRDRSALAGPTLDTTSRTTGTKPSNARVGAERRTGPKLSAERPGTPNMTLGVSRPPCQLRTTANAARRAEVNSAAPSHRCRTRAPVRGPRAPRRRRRSRSPAAV
jgi:hypothetical protein